jgi:hypothetical protein
MTRWLLISVLCVILHTAVSAALFFGAFMFGMASFNGGGGKESAFLLRAFDVWHAPYSLVWRPIATHMLPVVPAAMDIPKDGDTGGWQLYEAHRKEVIRIAGIHTAVRNLGYVFSTIAGGCVIGGIYVFLKRNDEKTA